jgi:hypothetical protein
MGSLLFLTGYAYCVLAAPHIIVMAALAGIPYYRFVSGLWTPILPQFLSVHMYCTTVLYKGLGSREIACSVVKEPPF